MGHSCVLSPPVGSVLPFCGLSFFFFARASLLVRILFDFLIHAPLLSHRAPQGAHPAPSLAAPRLHRRFAYPPPPPRPALLRLVRPPPPTSTPPQRAHHAARLPASSRRLGGCALLAQRPAAQSQNALHRFGTASGPDARFLQCSFCLCRFEPVCRCVRHGWAWAGRGGPLRACSQLAPVRCPVLAEKQWRSERREPGGGLRAGGTVWVH